MNNKANPIGALSELDRLGQACLDAIWEEESMFGENREEILKLVDINPFDLEDGEASARIDRLASLLGVEKDIQKVMTRALQIFQAGVARRKAVENYLMARRLMSKAGLL